MPDDAIYARQVAEQFGVDLHEIEIAPDVVDLLPRMVDILDEPIGDPAAINTLLICEAARDAGVKVLLSGMGADELFGGYRKHLACLLAVRYQRLPRPLRRGLSAGVGPAAGRRGGRGFRYGALGEAVPLLRRAAGGDGVPAQLHHVRPGRAARPDRSGPGRDVEDVLTEHRDVYQDNHLDDLVNRMCLADSRMFLPGLNLAYTDRSSMAASTEVRVPFVDPRWSRPRSRCPATERSSGGSRRLALKEAAEAWLPREIVYRPKASFSAPLRAWMTERPARPLVDDVAGAAASSSVPGSCAATRCRGSSPTSAAGREDYSKQLWQVLTLEYWYRGATCGSARRDHQRSRLEQGARVKQVAQNYKSR